MPLVADKIKKRILMGANAKYDILYGMDIGRYAKRHGTTVDALIRKTAVDIELLRENYQRYARRNTDLSDEEVVVAREISDAIVDKKEHLERLLEWKEQSQNRIYAGFWLEDGSHVTWEYAPGNCSLPDGVIPGDNVTVRIIGKYSDDNVEVDIVEVVLRSGDVLTHQENGTVLHITRSSNGVHPVASGQRATKRGWKQVCPMELTAVAGFLEISEEGETLVRTF